MGKIYNVHWIGTELTRISKFLVVHVESLIRFNDKYFSYGKQCIEMINFASHAEKLLELHSNHLIGFWELLGKTSTNGAGEKSKVAFYDPVEWAHGAASNSMVPTGFIGYTFFILYYTEASSHISLWVYLLLVWVLEKMQMTAKLLLSLQNGNCG